VDEQEGLLAAVTALSAYFVGDASMQETLTRVSELARRTLQVSDEVGITLVVDGRPATYVFTDPEIPEVDQAQYETGDGPCLTAYETGETVLVASTRSALEYPRFCAAAAAHGILSVVSFPLRTPAGPIGAMNHYANRESVFGPAEIELGERFAAQAAYLLVNAQAYWDARTLSENLAEAMKSRAHIEQAKGIIMARAGTDEDGAFALLREQSQAENRKLRDVADEIVRHASRRPRPSAPGEG
jgi:GAF domain-containing protein